MRCIAQQRWVVNVITVLAWRGLIFMKIFGALIVWSEFKALATHYVSCNNNWEVRLFENSDSCGAFKPTNSEVSSFSNLSMGLKRHVSKSTKRISEVVRIGQRMHFFIGKRISSLNPHSSGTRLLFKPWVHLTATMVDRSVFEYQLPFLVCNGFEESKREIWRRFCWESWYECCATVGLVWFVDRLIIRFENEWWLSWTGGAFCVCF